MKNSRYTFTLSILSLFSLSAILLSVFLISNFYQKSLAQAYTLLKDSNLNVTQTIADTLQQDFTATREHLRLLNTLTTESSLANDTKQFHRIMYAQLQASPNLASIFVADRLGSFLQSRREPEFARRTLLRTAGSTKDLWQFLDVQGNPQRQEARPATYDPRTRTWYQRVSEATPSYGSEPYFFASTGVMGITFAQGMFDQQGDLKQVAAADYTLESLSGLLTKKSADIQGALLIVDQNKKLLAYSDNWQQMAERFSLKDSQLGNALASPLGERLQLNQASGELNSSDNTRFLSFTASMPGVNGQPWYLVSLIEKELIVEDIKTDLIHTVVFSIFIIGLCYLPIHFLVAVFIIRPIRELRKITDHVAQQKFDEITPVSTVIYEFDQLSSSINQMVSAIHSHEKQQEELIDSFIKILAGAIDAKSPYTGGHCERLPEIAQRLAEAAHHSQKGSLAEFSFTSQEQWREFEIAAWLHDCGKVVTPEYVVDKATKLETICNRIHEIRMRFEVLHREATIHFYRQCQQHPEDSERLEQEMYATQQQLQDDFEFLATCNIGGEFMDDDKISRIKTLSQITWPRHFDDRLGLSLAEEHRIEKLGLHRPALPATEYLLADKPEHLIERDKAVSEERYQAIGSKMPIPKLARNLGEVYNLCIRKGTLSDEERFTVNEHILATISMLEQIPFTEDLQNVPEYAGNHHERMDGKGYPRQLTREQLSIPARIIAIADVFEALTAHDRPYKKAKTLSESLKIMYFMKKEGHIDPELFDLFLSSGVYRDYARRFLKPEQLDEIDIHVFIDQRH